MQQHVVHNKPSLLKKLRRQKYLLLMVTPSFILTILFAYVPLVGWIMAFTEYKLGMSVFAGRFTGLLQFYRFLGESKDYVNLIRNTLVINVSSVIVNLFLAVFFAILLNEISFRPAKKAVQTATFFPFFISWVITYSVVWSLFAVRSGAINQILVSTGTLSRGINLLGDPSYSWGLMIGLNIWKFLGYNSIIFLAAISGISTEQYEAAAIDGASRYQRIIYVTLPHLIPTISILLIMNSGWIFNSNLEQFFIFTNPSNWDTMEVLDMYIYKFGLRMLDYSYATAVGILKTIVSIIMLAIVNGISRKLTEASIF